MPRPSRPRRPFTLSVSLVSLVTSLVVAAGLGGVSATPAAAESYVPISGAGSTWSQNAIDQWRRNVNQYGMKVNYQGSGSSDGRNQFRNGTVDFAVSEIPYGLSDGGVVDTPPERSYAYMPIVAGGTAFMYNLKIGGKRVTNLRLSGENIAKIFTGGLKRWDDPALKADNPGLQLPARSIVPVVRSDGSGTTAQFSTYLAKRHSATWDAYCASAGRSTKPCGVTSNYPVASGRGFVAQSGSLGVAGYVAQAQSEGAITYVEYSYALNSGFPVAKMLNDNGYYVEPTASNVAVALLQAKINTDKSSSQYLTQILDGVYGARDNRAYPMSSYSYIVLPTEATGTFNLSKGKTLGDFGYYFLCEGQQQAPVLGFSPLPINLVQAGLEQIRKIPGVDPRTVDIKKCNNPTFSASGENTMAKNAPQPPACDKRGPVQCGTGTGGAKQSTATTGRTAPTGTVGAGSASLPAGAGQPAAGAIGSAGSPVLPGAAELDPALAAAASTAVDPDTGVAAGAAPLAGGTVAALPVSLTDASTGGSAPVLMAVAALVLVCVTLLPPLLSRRLRRSAP